MTSYWQKARDQRISRRRGLALAGGTLASAAFLAACGGDDDVDTDGGSLDPGDSTSPGSSVATRIEDTSDDAKRGGVLNWYIPSGDPVNLDMHIGQGGTKNLVFALTVGALVNYKPGIGEPPVYEEMAPEIAESWEWSSDGLELTLKLRNGVQWHNKPPINGRSLDTEDVLFSWDRWSELGTQRSLLVNSLNPNAPVLGLESPDRATLVFKLKEPTNYFLSSLSPHSSGHFSIVPRETDSTYDSQRDVVSSGPFMVESLRPSQGMTFVRNPDYFDEKKPFVDRIELPYVAEYAQMVAQFKAGAIITSSAGPVFPPFGNVIAEEIFLIKNEQPALDIYVMDQFGFHTTNTLGFGWLPAGNSPFNDERVRQALSMSYDRELFIETFNGVSDLANAGIPMKTAWATALGPAPGWKLDPREDEFGENAKYYLHNIEEAKKLLAAAGFSDGIDLVCHIQATLPGSPRFDETVEVRNQMAQDAGFRATIEILDFPVLPEEYLSGKYEGWNYRGGRQGAEDAVSWLEYRYSPNGGPGFLGFDVGGTGDGSGDPEVNALILKARGQFEAAERRETIFALDRYLSKKMYTIPHPGVASNVQMAWPALKNFLAFNGDRRSFPFDWWLDDSLPPLA